MTAELQSPDGARSKMRFISERYYGEPMIQYMFPINFRGKHVGTLIIDAKETDFRTMVERYNTFYDGKFVITDNDDRILYDTDRVYTGRIIDRSDLSKSRVYVETPINESNWKLFYIYRINPKLLLIRKLVFSMVAVSFLLAVGFSLYLGYSITKPIIQLHRKMGQIQIGDYSARASIGTNDEIGFLGNQFNRMVSTIQQLIENDLRLQLANKETQIHALQAQISPHFLYNTLQMITSIAMANHVPVIKRVQLLCGIEYDLELHSKPEKGTCVTFRLPLNKLEGEIR